MPTTLVLPTRQELVAFNRLTADGDGSVVNEENLDDTLNLQNAAFDYDIRDLNDPVQLGMAFAFCIANGHPFSDGNKSTATFAFEFIQTNNGNEFVVEVNSPELKTIVNNMVPDEEEEGISAMEAADQAAVYVKPKPIDEAKEEEE